MWFASRRALVLRGLVTIAFGLLLICSRSISLELFVLLFGAFALVDGGLIFTTALARGEPDRRIGLFAGVLAMLIGIITLLWPGLTRLTLLILLVLRALVVGAAELATAVDAFESRADSCVPLRPQGMTQVPLPSYRRPRTVLILLGAAFIGAAILRTTRLPAAVPAGDTPPPAAPVFVATASRVDVPVRLSALGSVAAFNTVTVRPRVDGQLMRVAFREGQFVTRGDLLGEIDRRPFEVQLEQAQGQLARDEAQLANARVDLARYQTLLSQDSIARQNVDAQLATVAQLEAALKVDQAAIDSARLNLTYSRVTAPISGRVGLRLVDAGNVVSASSTSGLVVITQVEPIAVVFTLPEDALRTVLPRIRAGTKLPVDAFDRSGSTRLASGSVVTLDNQIDQSTGTVRVKAVFDNRDHALFPDQFVNVQLLADTKPEQLVIPASAVQQGPKAPFVYIVRDGKAAVRPVTVGITEAERASIVSGLDAGDLVVTDGVDRLREGSAVEVRR